MGKGQPPKECGPASVDKEFDYDYFDCIIRQYTQQDTYGRRVMVLTKNRGVNNKNKKYNIEYKNVTYFVNTQNPYMPLIYFTPSNNKYNYFYMLSKAHDQSTYVGEHFTFGYKAMDDSTTPFLDIHYTSYATGGASPCYLFYNFNENMSKEFMTQEVCSKSNRCDSSPGNLQNRCWFFSTLINLVQPVHEVLMTKNMQTIPMYGGQEIEDANEQGQFKGKNLDTQFAEFFFGSMTNVDIDMIDVINVIEVHLIKANYGIVQAFKNGETMRKNSNIYTFGFFLDQDNYIYVTSIDAIVNGLSKRSANISPPVSVSLSSLANATVNLDKLNLATQALFEQLLPSNMTHSLTTQPNTRQQVPVLGGRKKQDKDVGRTSENRKKKV